MQKQDETKETKLAKKLFLPSTIQQTCYFKSCRHQGTQITTIFTNLTVNFRATFFSIKVETEVKRILECIVQLQVDVRVQILNMVTVTYNTQNI